MHLAILTEKMEKSFKTFYNEHEQNNIFFLDL